MGTLQDADDDDDTAHEGDNGFDADVTRLPTARGVNAEHMPFWSAGRMPLTSRQRLLRVVTVVVAFALALTVIARIVGLPSTPTMSATPTSTVNPVPTGPSILGYREQVCLKDAAWSPNSREIAVLVENVACTLNTYHPGTLRLYDVTNQRTTASFSLDAPIFAALGVAPPTQATPTPGTQTSTALQTPTIFHQSVVWSHDGGELAISFLAILTFTPNEVNVPGLALISSDGTHERVLLGSEASTANRAPLEWDLQRGTLANITYPAARNTGFSSPLTLPSGLGYSWQPDGALAPLSVAPAQAGDPIGGATFSLWQPGQLDVGTQPSDDAVASPPAYVFTSTFAAWSPDGRYLIPAATAGALLQPVGHAQPTPQLLKLLDITQLPVDTALDPCLQGIIDTMPSLQYQSSVEVAWRSDALVLALSTGGEDLTIYECATGRKIASAKNQWPSDNAIGLSWSPDGSWLLLPNGAIRAASQLGS